MHGSEYHQGDEPPADILDTLREAEGYYLCNNERDVSQSDFKNRLMPMTTCGWPRTGRPPASSPWR